jgi:ribosomal protein L18
MSGMITRIVACTGIMASVRRAAARQRGTRRRTNLVSRSKPRLICVRSDSHASAATGQVTNFGFIVI